MAIFMDQTADHESLLKDLANTSLHRVGEVKVHAKLSAVQERAYEYHIYSGNFFRGVKFSQLYHFALVCNNYIFVDMYTRVLTPFM